MAGPCGLAAGPCEPWLWLAALQGSVCFVGRAAACERTENGFLLLTARGSTGRSKQGMQRISHLFYYTTPAVGKSRTAATGRSGWAEAADRFARAALCLRLLYHKTLSTGTKTRGKSGSCLKKHPEFRKRFRAFFRRNNSPWETQSGFLRHGETFRNREDPAVLFRPQTPLGKRGRFYRQYGRGRGIRGKAGVKVSKYYEK